MFSIGKGRNFRGRLPYLGHRSTQNQRTLTMKPVRLTVLCTILLCGTTATLGAQGGRPQMQPAGSPQPLAGLPRTHKPEPTTEAIDVRDLMTRDYIIADDSMEGRNTGARGGFKATNYIAAELKRLGLQPAGESGSYFQNVPFTMHRPDSMSALEIDGKTFRQFADFLCVPRLGLPSFLGLGGQPFGGTFSGNAVATVWGGQIGDANMLDPALAKGKVVVFSLPANASGPQAWQFWNRGENLTRYQGARAVVVDIGSGPIPSSPGVVGARLYYNDTSLKALPLIVGSSAITAAVFGADAGTLKPGAPGKPVSGRFGYSDSPTEAPTRNVVGIIPGSDPLLRNQYVAIGAHSDHVGIFPGGPVDHDSIRALNSIGRPRGADDRGVAPLDSAQWAHVRALIDTLHKAHGGPRLDSIMNGADDDGSGTVLALEIAEAFAKAKVKPKRSLLFVFHAAEETGLFGADYFADHPTVPRDSIVAQINMDQMGRGGPEDAPPGGANSLVAIGARRLSAELGDIAERVNAQPQHSFKFDYSFDAPGDPSQGYCRSDHYMYARYGIPVLFFVSAVWYIDYHMVSDEPQYIDYPRMAKVGNYIKDVVGEVANLAHRPLVDKARGDPNAVCRQ